MQIIGEVRIGECQIIRAVMYVSPGNVHDQRCRINADHRPVGNFQGFGW